MCGVVPSPETGGIFEYSPGSDVFAAHIATLFGQSYGVMVENAEAEHGQFVLLVSEDQFNRSDEVGQGSRRQSVDGDDAVGGSGDNRMTQLKPSK